VGRFWTLYCVLFPVQRSDKWIYVQQQQLLRNNCSVAAVRVCPVVIGVT